MDHGAVVVGGGHNGLICAAYLARAGIDTLVVEARGRGRRLRLHGRRPRRPGEHLQLRPHGVPLDADRRRARPRPLRPALPRRRPGPAERARTTAVRPGRCSTTSIAPSTACGSPTRTRSTATAGTPPPRAPSPSWSSSWPTSRRRPVASCGRWPTGGPRASPPCCAGAARASARCCAGSSPTTPSPARPSSSARWCGACRRSTPRTGLGALTYAMKHVAQVGRPVGGSGSLPVAVLGALGSRRRQGPLRRPRSPPSCARASGCVGVELADGERIEAPIVVAACDPQQALVGWLRNPPAAARRPRRALAHAHPATTGTSPRSTP